MFGAIAGDIIGSVYERRNVKSTDFALFTPASIFTDDSVLTVAIADCLLHKKDYAVTLKAYGQRFPQAGYGRAFRKWLFSDSLRPYNSFGNGSAMRVSPVGFYFDTLEKVLMEAKRSAEVTHNHPEGIKGAQATAAAVFLARRSASKEEIKQYITEHFGYNLRQSLDEIRHYRFDTCQGSGSPGCQGALESSDYEMPFAKRSLSGEQRHDRLYRRGVPRPSTKNPFHYY